MRLSVFQYKIKPTHPNFQSGQRLFIGIQSCSNFKYLFRLTFSRVNFMVFDVEQKEFELEVLETFLVWVLIQILCFAYKLFDLLFKFLHFSLTHFAWVCLLLTQNCQCCHFSVFRHYFNNVWVCYSRTGIPLNSVEFHNHLKATNLVLGINRKRIKFQEINFE